MSHHTHPNTPAAPAHTPHQTPERDGDVAGTRPGPGIAHEGAHRQTGAHTSPDPAREGADPR